MGGRGWMHGGGRANTPPTRPLCAKKSGGARLKRNARPLGAIGDKRAGGVFRPTDRRAERGGWARQTIADARSAPTN